MRLLKLAACAAVVLVTHSHAAAPNMREGLWEVTVRTEMPGMPAGMPPQTMQRCITKKDLEDPSRTTPGGEAPDKRCRMTDYRLQGNTATWKVACEGDNAMSGSGAVTYSGTSYSGKQTLSMKLEGKPLDVTVYFSGRHLGECRK